jgi:DNA-binding response OmpR family regulator
MLTDVITVLIVEDDLLIADMVEDRLLMDGFDVCGIATNIEEGLAMATEFEPNVAIVDVRLADGDLGTTLGMALQQLKMNRSGAIAILYATGNIDLVTRDAAVVGEACLKKPYNLENLCRSVRLVHQMVHAATIAEPPFPEGLIMLKSQDSAPSIDL